MNPAPGSGAPKGRPAPPSGPPAGSPAWASPASSPERHTTPAPGFSTPEEEGPASPAAIAAPADATRLALSVPAVPASAPRRAGPILLSCPPGPPYRGPLGPRRSTAPVPCAAQARVHPARASTPPPMPGRREQSPTYTPPRSGHPGCQGFVRIGLERSAPSRRRKYRPAPTPGQIDSASLPEIPWPAAVHRIRLKAA